MLHNQIWKNTIKTAAKTRILSILATAFVWWLCIFWTIPVAVIGAISNINVCDHFSMPESND